MGKTYKDQRHMKGNIPFKKQRKQTRNRFNENNEIQDDVSLFDNYSLNLKEHLKQRKY